MVAYSPSGRGGRREAASALAARRRPPVLRYIASAAPVTASVVEAAASTDDDTASPVLGCLFLVLGLVFGFGLFLVFRRRKQAEPVDGRSDRGMGRCPGRRSLTGVAGFGRGAKVVLETNASPVSTAIMGDCSPSLPSGVR